MAFLMLLSAALAAEQELSPETLVFRGLQAEHSVSLTGPSEGPVTLALDLSGSGSRHMLVSDLAFLREAAEEGALTISFWQLNTADNSSSLWAESPSSEHDQRGIHAHLPHLSNRIYFDTGGATAPRTRISTPTAYGHDWSQWTHVALVMNGARRQVWVDGRLAVAGNEADPLKTDFTRLFVGSGRDGSSNIDGRIDDFAIFRRALNASEIADLARDGSLPSVVALEIEPESGSAIVHGLALTLSSDPVDDPISVCLLYTSPSPRDRG